MKRWIRAAAAALLFPVLAASLPGCWDNHELDTLSIVTGVALDVSETPGKIDLSLQIGKTKSSAADSKDPGSGKNASILMTATCAGAYEGLHTLNRNSSRTLFMDHNQAILLGSKLAEQGLNDHLDMFMREQDSRVETTLLIVDGRAEEILKMTPEQEQTTGLVISRIMRDQSSISPYTRTRMLDYISRSMSKTSSPVIPIIRLHQEEDRQVIKLEGLAVISGGRMVGRLDNDQSQGYIWTMGKVKNTVIAAENNDGRAVFDLIGLDTRRDVSLSGENQADVSLSVNAKIDIGELKGFENYRPEELMVMLTGLAEDEIRSRIMGTFEAARALDADIFEFGASVHQKYPKAWKEMKGRWSDIFPKIGLTVKVKAVLPQTGQIVESLQMEEANNED